MGLTKRSANVPQIPKSVDSGVPNHLAHKVTICHPGYNDASDDLISFPAFDGLNGGLYFDTALIACGIITGNNWDGSFSKDIKGKEVISHESCDGILPPGLYYFHLPAFNGLCRDHLFHGNQANTWDPQINHTRSCPAFVIGCSPIAIFHPPGPVLLAIQGHSKLLQALDRILRCSFSFATMANAG